VSILSYCIVCVISYRVAPIPNADVRILDLQNRAEFIQSLTIQLEMVRKRSVVAAGECQPEDVPEVAELAVVTSRWKNKHSCIMAFVRRAERPFLCAPGASRVVVTQLILTISKRSQMHPG
jgi:hypothetical protein